MWLWGVKDQRSGAVGRLGWHPCRYLERRPTNFPKWDMTFALICPCPEAQQHLSSSASLYLHCIFLFFFPITQH